MESSAIAIELRELRKEADRRMDGLHRSVGGLATDVGGNKSDIAVLKKDGLSTERNIAQLEASIGQLEEKMEKGFERIEAKIDGQFTTWRRTIWTGAGLIIAAGGVLVTLITQHG